MMTMTMIRAVNYLHGIHEVGQGGSGKADTVNSVHFGLFFFFEILFFFKIVEMFEDY